MASRSNQTVAGHAEHMPLPSLPPRLLDWHCLLFSLFTSGKCHWALVRENSSFNILIPCSRGAVDVGQPQVQNDEILCI